MGKGEAGKTSLVQRLKELELGVKRKDLPKAADRTIGIEMTTLQDTFVVHDFGGQPEYYPWHKLFLTQGALYAVVVDLAEGEEARKNALLEQLDILNASVPGAVVIVVGTKSDLVAQAEGTDGAGARLVALEAAANAWLERRAEVAQVVSMNEDDADRPPLIMRYIKTSACEKGQHPSERGRLAQDSIRKVSTALNGAARAKEPHRLFPRFEAEVPMIWERVRGMLEAMKHDRAAAFVTPPRNIEGGGVHEEEDGDEDNQRKATRDETNRAVSTDVKRHHALYTDVVAAWDAALGQNPNLAEELAGVGARQTLVDALSYLEGEGDVLRSHTSGIVHLNPSWLAETVKPIADHRLQGGADFVEELAGAMEDQGLRDYSTAIEELHLFAKNAQCSKSLLRCLLTLENAPTGHVNVLARYGTTLETLCDLMVEHRVMFRAPTKAKRSGGSVGEDGGGGGGGGGGGSGAGEVSFIVPTKLPTQRPDEFDTALKEGQTSCTCRVKFNTRKDFPPGLVEMTMAVLQDVDEELPLQTFYRFGGMLHNQARPKRKSLFYFEYPTLVLQAQAQCDEDDEDGREELFLRVSEMKGRVKEVVRPDVFKGLRYVAWRTELKSCCPPHSRGPPLGTPSESCVRFESPRHHRRYVTNQCNAILLYQRWYHFTSLGGPPPSGLR